MYIGKKKISYSVYCEFVELVNAFDLCVIPRAKQKIDRQITKKCIEHNINKKDVLRECR